MKDTYATSSSGEYDSYATASSGSTNNYRFVSVSANATLPFYFMAIIPGLPAQQLLTAKAISGEQSQSTLSNGGLLPFAPDAHNQADTTNLGLTPGVQYPLKWANGNSITCAGDAGFTPPGNPPSEHGVVDIGEGNGTSNIRLAIGYGGYPNANSSLAIPSSLATGDSLGGTPGNRGSSNFSALKLPGRHGHQRHRDHICCLPGIGDRQWRTYRHVAIAGTWSGNASNAATTILGFVKFFLNRTYSESSGAICATYIGPASLNGNASAATDATKIYSVNLFQ